MSQIVNHKDRNMSDFMAEELLYDYAVNCLDENRKKDLIGKISKSKHLKEKLKSIEFALEYCEKLSHTKISQPLIEELSLKSPEPRDFNFGKYWGRLSEWTKIGVQSLGITVIVSLIAISIPWQYFFKNDDLSTAEKIILAKKIEAPIVENKEIIIEAKKDLIAAEEATIEAEAAEIIKNEVKVPVKAVVVEVQEAAEEKKTVEKVVLNGLVYRIQILPNNPAQDNEFIRKILLDNGAEKAGKVKLGWLRKDGSYYYHFQVGKENYEKIKSKLSESYKINIVIYAHKREMPKGFIRSILTVN